MEELHDKIVTFKHVKHLTRPWYKNKLKKNFNHQLYELGVMVCTMPLMDTLSEFVRNIPNLFIGFNMFENEDAFESHEEFERASQAILHLSEAQERGEITAEYLFKIWKIYRRKAEKYFYNLKQEIKLN